MTSRFPSLQWQLPASMRVANDKSTTKLANDSHCNAADPSPSLAPSPPPPATVTMSIPTTLAPSSHSAQPHPRHLGYLQSHCPTPSQTPWMPPVTLPNPIPAAADTSSHFAQPDPRHLGHRQSLCLATPCAAASGIAARTPDFTTIYQTAGNFVDNQPHRAIFMSADPFVGYLEVHMRFPKTSAGIGALLELGWFAICAFLADLDVAGQETLFHQVVLDMRKAVADRNTARDESVKMRAVRSVALRNWRKWLQQNYLDGVAAFGGKKQSLEFLRIYPAPPSGLLNQSAEDRLKSGEKLLKALADPATPPALAKSAVDGKKRLDAVTAAEKGVTAALAVVDSHVHNIAVVRAKWFPAYTALHASAVAKFPDDKDRVESYFDSPAAPDKPMPAPAPAPGA